MSLSCLVIDDDQLTIDRLHQYIDDTSGIVFSGSSTDPAQVLRDLEQWQSPDLVFLDIDMPQLCGLDLAKLLHPRISVVFITAFREFALDAYEQHALDYLLKPVSYDRFYRCVKRVEELVKPPGRSDDLMYDCIFVNADARGRQVKLKLKDILYVESVQNYVSVYLTNRKVITYLTLSEMLALLPAGDFCRIHKSFIINLDKLSSLSSDEVTLENGKQLTIGRVYKELIMNRIEGISVKSKRLNKIRTGL